MQVWFVLLAHLFGDFILQNDWMAVNKKKSSFVCLVHVVTYLLPFLICAFSWWQLFLIGAQHFIQDRTKMASWFLEVTGKKQFAQPPLAPWSIIVTDNIFHIAWIVFVMQIGVQ